MEAVEDAGTFSAQTRIEILRKELKDGKITYRGSVRERNKGRKYVGYISEATLNTIHKGRLASYRARPDRTGNFGRTESAGLQIQDRKPEIEEREAGRDYSAWKNLVLVK